MIKNQTKTGSAWKILFKHLKDYRPSIILLAVLGTISAIAKKANKCSLAFLPVLRPPFLRRLRRPEAPPSPRLVVVQ